MSKLARSINPVLTSRKDWKPEIPNLAYSESWSTPDIGAACGIYTIGATLSVTIGVSELERCQARHSYNIDQITKRARVGLVEEVFGEFREPLFKLQNAILNRDQYGALDILDKLHSSMFHDGI